MNEHTQAARTEGSSCRRGCGCLMVVPVNYTGPPQLSYCPMHAAAPKLLKVCMRAAYEYQVTAEIFESTPRGPGDLIRAERLRKLEVAARAAIAEAEPK